MVCFTPLVFSTSGSMGREASTFYKRLADMLSNKQGKPYSIMMGWSPVFCQSCVLRSSHFSFGHPLNEEQLILAGMYKRVECLLNQTNPIMCISSFCARFCCILSCNANEKQVLHTQIILMRATGYNYAICKIWVFGQTHTWLVTPITLGMLR